LSNHFSIISAVTVEGGELLHEFIVLLLKHPETVTQKRCYLGCKADCKIVSKELQTETWKAQQKMAKNTRG